MYDYPLLIAGADAPGTGSVFVLRASDYLRDPRGTFARRVDLEKGQRGFDPTDPSVVGRVALAGPEDNARALAAAAAAAPVWAAMPTEVRFRVLDEFREAVIARAAEMIDVLVRAEGHPRKLAEWEVAGLIGGTGREVNAWVRNQFDRGDYLDGKQVRLVRKADGVVCLSPPKNAAASNSGMGISCLAAGNALVVKAPKSAPLGVAWVYREIVAPILARVGAPPGTLSLVCGHTPRILDEWVESPLVDDIFFFGDSKVGLELGQRCYAAGKKPVLELAGNDGVVVWKDADVDGAADALMECFLGSSQICMVPKYALVHPAVADALFTALLARVDQARPGFPESPDVVLSPVLRDTEFFAFLQEAVDAGARVLCGGQRLDVEGRPAPRGGFLAPTVVRLDGFARAHPLRAFREETFFPLLPVAVAEPGDDAGILDAMIQFVDANAYGLRNSLWARDLAVIDTFTARVKTGGLLKVNTSHVGFEPMLATHGGTGRTAGPGGELNYPAMRTSHLQGIAVRRPARMPLAAGPPPARQDAVTQALAGRTAVVTGASRGIGAATARALARCGVRVVLVARSGDALDHVVDSVAAVGGVAARVVADLAVPADVRRAVDEIHQLVGTPDLLVNNAGAGRWRYTEETSPDELQSMLAVPFLAAFQLTAALLPGMLARRSGRVVNLTSAMAWLPIPGATGYTSARWAVRGFSESLRLDLHGTGVGVTLVVAGRVDTPYFEHNPGSVERMPWASRLLPTLRPEEVAEALVAGAARGDATVFVPRGLDLFRVTRTVLPRVVDGLAWHTGWRRKGPAADA